MPRSHLSALLRLSERSQDILWECGSERVKEPVEYRLDKVCTDAMLTWIDHYGLLFN